MPVMLSCYFCSQIRLVKMFLPMNQVGIVLCVRERGFTKKIKRRQSNIKLTSSFASTATIFDSRLSFLRLSHCSCRFKKLKSAAFSSTAPALFLSMGRYCDEDFVVRIVLSIVEQDALLAAERILLPIALFPPVGPEKTNTILGMCMPMG